MIIYTTFSVYRNKKKLNTETQRHGEKNEGGRAMDEKEETSIIVSSFILSKFSPCLCVSVFFISYFVKRKSRIIYISQESR